MSRPSGTNTGRAPDRASLQEAALSYLGRFASTQENLRRVLQRRVARWEHAATAAGADPEQVAAAAKTARAEIAGIVARLAQAGAVDDRAFASARVRRLARGGKSRRLVAAHLAAKGVSAEIAAQVLPSAADERAAALSLARRRRIGPFREGAPPDAQGLRRELAVFARAGFPAEIAAAVQRLSRAEAEEALLHAAEEKEGSP